MANRSKFAIVLVAGALLAPAQETSEKPLLVSTLRQIVEAVSTIRQPGVAPVMERIAASAKWMENRVGEWTPERSGEGLPLLASLGRMLKVLREPPAGQSELKTLLNAVAEDLSDKVEHCKQTGLAASQRVEVVTKRNGVDEVKGLAVLYVEKFFQHDPSARPREFRHFSSPAVEDLVPGRYIIWAKETSGSGRTGPTKEVRIGGGSPKDAVEVLAP